MRVFVTGATGFVMGRVARALRSRGDEVVALVREASRAKSLADAGCELAVGDLADAAALRGAMRGCDAVVHGAAIYEVGIPSDARAAMHEANVLGTERVLSAAAEARPRKVVHVSTIAAFGDTRGRVVDETYRHPGTGYTSYYEETKHRSHEIALEHAARGLPIVVVQPGQVYGPGDHSGVGAVMSRLVARRLPVLAFPELGLNFVHVDDVAQGVLLALDKGRVGECYVLGGEMATMRGMLDTLARVTGRPRPRFAIPTGLLRFAARIRPELREVVASADGVTFWAKDDKARRELGYAPRPLARGLAETFSGR